MPGTSHRRIALNGGSGGRKCSEAPVPDALAEDEDPGLMEEEPGLETLLISPGVDGLEDGLDSGEKGEIGEPLEESLDNGTFFNGKWRAAAMAPALRSFAMEITRASVRKDLTL